MLSPECPACGYSPEPAYDPAPFGDLWIRRMRDIIYKNASKSWWFTQPTYVCKWLSGIIKAPRTVLDVGCGYGRWLPAMMSTFPKTVYTGVDRIAEHISQYKEKMPEFNWVLGDVSLADGPFDLALIMGTLNPKMEYAKQDKLMRAVLAKNPKQILVSFDRNSTGILPDEWLGNKIATLEIPKDEQGPMQNVVVWLYHQHRQRRQSRQ